jgi:predicted alpha/beta hydrolase
VRTTIVTIGAGDGVSLAGTWYEADPTPWASDRPVVVVNSAAAVKRIYYDRFARFLAEDGFTVLTYDYRGIGDSRPAHLRGFQAHLRDWGETDLTGVLDWIDNRVSGRRLVAIGHSLGGQIIGLSPRSRRISAILGVAAQTGWWGHWPRPDRYALALLWYVVMPGAAAALGYFPARRLGLGEDLPGDIAREWARWCRSRHYMIDASGAPLRPHFDAFAGPLLALSFADDRLAPAEAVSELASYYSRAAVFREHIDPREVGVESIGHFGFFRERARSALWERAAAWLREPSPCPLVTND